MTNDSPGNPDPPSELDEPLAPGACLAFDERLKVSNLARLLRPVRTGGRGEQVLSRLERMEPFDVVTPGHQRLAGVVGEQVRVVSERVETAPRIERRPSPV